MEIEIKESNQETIDVVETMMSEESISTNPTIITASTEISTLNNDTEKQTCIPPLLTTIPSIELSEKQPSISCIVQAVNSKDSFQGIIKKSEELGKLRNAAMQQNTNGEIDNTAAIENNSNVVVAVGSEDILNKGSTSSPIPKHTSIQSSVVKSTQPISNKTGLQWISDYGRNESSESNSSSSEVSSDSGELSSDASEDSVTVIHNTGKTKNFEEKCYEPSDNKTRGELDLKDLPHLEDLHISVPKQEIQLIGNVSSIVGCLVVIQSFPNEKPLDLESVLFLKDGTALGKIFDVFGRVISPFYSVRFNDESDIKARAVIVGDEVYFAPKRSGITNYVFTEHLLKQKGSDASWKYNNEPPEEFLEFSDDEQEKQHKHRLRGKNKSIRNEVEIVHEVNAMDGSEGNISAFPHQRSRRRPGRFMRNSRSRQFRNPHPNFQRMSTEPNSGSPLLFGNYGQNNRGRFPPPRFGQAPWMNPFTPGLRNPTSNNGFRPPLMQGNEYSSQAGFQQSTVNNQTPFINSDLPLTFSLPIPHTTATPPP